MTLLPYAPRTAAFLDVETVRGWTVKRYGLSAERARPPAEVLDAGRVAVERSLPDACPGGLTQAVSIAHEDTDGCYFVIGWWTPNRLIMCTRTWLSSWESPSELTEAPDNMTVCVWELPIIAHEHRAWITHVLRPQPPDLPAYLADTVSGPV